MRLFSVTVVFIFCLLLLTNSCRDSAKQMRIRNIELKQDIHTSGIAELSHLVTLPIAPSEIRIRFKPNNYWLGLGSAEKFGIRFKNQYGQYIEAGYDVYRQLFYTECRHSTSTDAIPNIQLEPYTIDDTKLLNMRIMLNNNSIALFAMDGSVELTSMYYYSSDFDKLELFAENGKVFVEFISFTHLKPTF